MILNLYLVWKKSTDPALLFTGVWCAVEVADDGLFSLIHGKERCENQFMHPCATCLLALLQRQTKMAALRRQSSPPKPTVIPMA